LSVVSEIDSISRSTWRGDVQFTPTATTLGAAATTSTAFSMGVPSQTVSAVAAAEAHPRGDLGHPLERAGQGAGFDERGDRLDCEHVGLGLGERLDPRHMELDELVLVLVVVARVLGAVAEHRPVGADRRGDDPVTARGLAGELDAPPHQLGGLIAFDPAAGEPSNVAW
jgi:hypothetical protein